MRRDASGRWVANESAWRWRVADERNALALPRALRERTLMAIVHDSSFYIDLQPGDGAEQYRASAVETVRRLKAGGFEAVGVGADFTPADYADRSHLAPEGGEKMAAVIAPVVRGMAERLRYLR
jgi:hypothetical protein